MKKYIVIFVGVLATACAAAGMAVSFIYWDINGQNLVREWVSPSGRMDYQTLLNSTSTAIDLWPTPGTKPTVDSLSEITLQRCGWWEDCMERFNISAMVDGTNGGDYRFGVERGGTGQYRNIRFCFENYAPGMANCRLLITPDGLYTSDDGGTNWRRL